MGEFFKTNKDLFRKTRKLVKLNLIMLIKYTSINVIANEIFIKQYLEMDFSTDTNFLRLYI